MSDFPSSHGAETGPAATSSSEQNTLLLNATLLSVTAAVAVAVAVAVAASATVRPFSLVSPRSLLSAQLWLRLALREKGWP